MKKVLLWILALLLSPVLLFLLLTVLLYLPPVQNWAVQKATAIASEKTGMEISIRRVGLKFPLDLAIQDFLMIHRPDTIADVRQLTVDVQLWPLFQKEVVVNGLELTHTRLNTNGFISDLQVKGSLERLALSSRGIDLDAETAEVNGTVLEDADLTILLSDTAATDTTTSALRWVVRADDVSILRSRIDLHMPGDSMRVRAYLGDAAVREVTADLGKQRYTAGQLRWHDGSLDYDIPYEPAVAGLDYNHLSLTGIEVGIDSIFYQEPATALTIRYARMKEKSGLELKELSTAVSMDDKKLLLPHLRLRTADSDIEGRLSMDLNTFDEQHPGKMDIDLNASLGKQDVLRFAGDLPRQFMRQYPNRPITIKGSAHGNMQRLEFRGLDIAMARSFRIHADGVLTNLLDPDRLRADVTMKADAQDISYLLAAVSPELARNYRLPPGLAVSGNVKADGPKYTADLTARDGRGTIRAKGLFNGLTEHYQADLRIDRLNMRRFMPRDSIGLVSADIKASGKGLDFFSPRSHATATANIRQLQYGSWNLTDITADATLQNGRATGTVVSHNPLVDGTVSLDALLTTLTSRQKSLKATVSADTRVIDLYRLRLTDTPLTIGLCGHLDVESNMDDLYRVEGHVSDLYIKDSTSLYRPEDIDLDVFTRRDTTWAKIYSGDLTVDMAAKGGYQLLMDQGLALADSIAAQYKAKVIDQAQIKRMLPTMRCYITSRNDNPVAKFLQSRQISFRQLYVNMTTSPATGINGRAYLHSLVYDSIRIDTISLQLKDNGKRLTFNGQVQNNKRNPQFVFNALIDGHLSERGALAGLRFYDEKGKMGLRLGAEAQMEENGLRFHLLPEKPTIGYKVFTLNKDNFLFLGPNNKLQAKIDLIADDGTGVKIYSTDSPEPQEAPDSTSMPKYLQDLTVSLYRLNLGEVTSAIPYIPRITGLLNGDYHIVMDQKSHISVASDMSVSDMTYETAPLGNLSTEFVYLQKEDDTHAVEAILMKDNIEVGSLRGTYRNEGDGYLDAVFDMERLPLNIGNGFIPDLLFGFEGYAEGKVDVKGSLKRPQVDGEVFLDSAYLVSIPYGIRMRFDNDPVRIVGSRLMLENFGLYAYNDQPLNLQGEVSFADLDHMTMNLRMRAQNLLLINAKENAKSVAYGKGYVNLMAVMNGPVENLRMRGKLDVLGSTDLNYILRDSPLTTDNQLAELVKFTELSDTADAVVERPALTGFQMDMTVDVSKGAHVMAYLNTEKSNYIDLMGGGTLRMQYNTIDALQLHGRYTLSNGEMKYSLPVIPLRTFTIQDGSYLEFTGDPMNPRLNITAIEHTKATVANSSGVGRSVDFDCGIIVTKTLSDMGLEFTLDAPEDMALHNELQTMSPEQRGKLAVSMMTTGMYLADGNTQAFSMNSALSSFLNNEINNITGNALRTLDLSFGLDNSTDAAGNSHTDYSFKFAKRFWNNRLKISLGGKVSSGSDDAMGQNRSFFDNVSMEYRLDDTANKYVTLFYDNNVYDWLEGYTQQYGAGFIWRRSLQRFRDIFSLKGDQPVLYAPRDTTKAKPHENP